MPFILTDLKAVRVMDLSSSLVKERDKQSSLLVRTKRE